MSAVVSIPGHLRATVISGAENAYRSEGAPIDYVDLTYPEQAAGIDSDPTPDHAAFDRLRLTLRGLDSLLTWLTTTLEATPRVELHEPLELAVKSALAHIQGSYLPDNAAMLSGAQVRRAGEVIEGLERLLDDLQARDELALAA